MRAVSSRCARILNPPAFVRLAAVVVVVSALMVPSTNATAAGRRMTAITEMSPRMSSLRLGPAGKSMTAAQDTARLKGAQDSAATGPGNADQMGAPANKTVVPYDQVLSETNSSSENGTTTAGVSTFALNGSMSGIAGSPSNSPLSTPTPVPVDQRTTIDHQYPSVGGHFLNATRESVLDFKEGVAGNDGLFSLTSPNPAAEKSASVATTGSEAVPGNTYEIMQPSLVSTVAITNNLVPGSQALGTQAQSETLTAGAPDPTQLWNVVDAGHNDGSFSLVNRADGACLALNGQAVTVDSCIDDPTRHWLEALDPSNHMTHLYPVGSSLDFSVGGDKGPNFAATLGANTGQEWSFRAVTDAGVPSWSVPRPNGNTVGHIAAPADMAVGDLDGIPTEDAQAGGLAYHDEAVTAWVNDDNDMVELRVIDYNANSSHLLVTGLNKSVTRGKASRKLGDAQQGLGDVVVGVGDFDGRGRNEIVVGYQTGTAFTFTFYQYSATSSGGRTLQVVSCGSCGGEPFDPSLNISTQTGYADLAVGDFDGSGRDEIALAFATTPAGNTIDHYANLGIWTLNPDLSTRSVVVTPMPIDGGTLPRTMNSDGTRTSSGIKLAAGNFLFDPANGFGPQRQELAIAYSRYTIGGHVYNSITATDEHPYAIRPLINIYSASTSNCSNTTASCTTAMTPTNGSTEPQNLFPSNPYWTAYRNFGVSYDAAPLELTTGGFGGQDAATTNPPPVEGILASAWLESNEKPNAGSTEAEYYTEQSITVPWALGDDTHKKWAVIDAAQNNSAYSNPTVSNDSNWVLNQYTAYDRDGKSLVLGAPQILNIEGQIHENVVAAAPPTQIDWLNDGWVNVDAASNFNLTTSTSEGKTLTSNTSRQTTWGEGVTQGSGVKASWSTNEAVATEKGSIDIEQKFGKQWSGLNRNSTNTSDAWSTQASGTASEDDVFSYSSDNSILYRYPIIGSPGLINTTTGDCTSGCRNFYDVSVPLGSVQFDNQAGKSTTLFQPAWENLNALSYPAINSSAPNPVPTPGLGSYYYTDQNGIQQAVNAPLYNEVHDAGTTTGQVALNFSAASGSTLTRTTDRKWTTGLDVSASGTVALGSWASISGNNASLTVSASLGWDQSASTTSTNDGSSSTTSGQQFELNIPLLNDISQGYKFGTAYYYGTDGSARVVHGVDFQGDPGGKNWWVANYKQTPDPALNLPNRIELAYDSTNYYHDEAEWVTSPQRQLIRGFQVLQTNNDATGLPTAGDPYTRNPSAGDPVTFQVPVHNYSLAPMTAATYATWYAVPVDGDDYKVTGPAVPFGKSVVPAMGAQGSALVQSPSWNAIGAGGSDPATQQFRIFIKLDPFGTAADMHPLAGTACPTSSLVPSPIPKVTAALYDIMSEKQTPDPLGCGQDNQGYGLVTVSPATTAVGAARLGSPGQPARAVLAGGGLVDANPAHLKLTEKSSVPSIPAGQPVTGLVHASSQLLTNDHPLVAIYDGPVKAGHVVAVTQMNGISPVNGGSVSFSWTPTKPGLHELHEVLLGTSDTGEDDEQIMRVMVTSTAQYHVTAKADDTSVTPQQVFTITGSATPVGPAAWERAIELQKRVGRTWETVGQGQVTAAGHFQFTVTAPTRPGKYSYRALKLPATGQYEKASQPVTVVDKLGPTGSGVEPTTTPPATTATTTPPTITATTTSATTTPASAPTAMSTPNSPTAAEKSLPHTGFNSLTALLAALGLLTVGAVLAASGARRRRRWR